MRVLITGGAGFIGTALVGRLAQGGRHEVTVMDNLSSQVHGDDAVFPEVLTASARCLRGDVTVREDWLAALDGQEAVVHLAAETGTGQSLYESHRYAAVNVLGTALLTDLLREKRIELDRVVLASSRAVYGEGCYACGHCGAFQPEARDAGLMEQGDFELRCPGCGRQAAPVPTPEDARPLPVSIYGVTKLAQENVLRVFARSTETACAALRFQNVYGPGQSLRNPYTGILSVFSSLILTGGEVELYEDGLESRDFVYVDDAAEAIERALEAETLPHDVYNVGSGSRTTVAEIAHLLSEGYGREASVRVSGRFRSGDVRHCIADTARFEADLGAGARTSLRDGIERFCAWVRAEQMPDSRYLESADELAVRGLLRESHERS